MITLTIDKWLSHHATYRPHHLAVVFEDKRLSFYELNLSINRLCNALQEAGISKGDKIATFLPNSLELYELYWATAKMGAVIVPMSPLVRGNGLINLFNDADAKLIVTDQAHASFIDDVRNHLSASFFWLTDTDEVGWENYHQQKANASESEPKVETIVADDLYNIMYSSGTTGLPKGIVHSHFVRAMYGSLFANAFRITPESVVMHSGAIIFNGSMLTFMPAMYMGCTFVLLKEFNASKVIDCIAQEQVTHTILVPTQIIGCLKYPRFTLENLPSIEYILSVGAPLLEETKREFTSKFPRIFYELYGLTEGFMTILDRTVSDIKIGSVGRPPIFMNMKIVDGQGQEVPAGTVGEIIGNGPLLMPGYYQKPELTRETIKDGWLYTGDLGYVDEDGYLFLAGRKKELIISGGVNVYPKDIEEIIIRHPAVQEVAVFGVPHPDWGETPVAAVVLNSKAVTASDIAKWTNNNIEARFQKISDVYVLHEFPKNAAGKVVKGDLLKMYRGCYFSSND